MSIEQSSKLAVELLRLVGEMKVNLMKDKGYNSIKILDTH